MRNFRYTDMRSNDSNKRLKIFLAVLLICLPVLFAGAQNSATDFLKYAVEATGKGDYTGAIALCDRSIALNNKNELAYYHRGYNRFMLGDYKGAIDDANTSIELNSNIADTYLLRAEARLKIGERWGAISDYNRARRIDGSGTLTHFAQNIVRAIF